MITRFGMTPDCYPASVMCAGGTERNGLRLRGVGMKPTPRILVVDDDPEISGLIEQILAAGAYAVEIARDGGSALARLDEDIDLVLLDVMMPGLNGLQVCRRMRAERGFAQIPIIMVTALGGDTQRHAGVMAGTDDYIAKPFTAHELLDRVHVWLRARDRFRGAAASPAAPVETTPQLPVASGGGASRLEDRV